MLNWSAYLRGFPSETLISSTPGNSWGLTGAKCFWQAQPLTTANKTVPNTNPREALSAITPPCYLVKLQCGAIRSMCVDIKQWPKVLRPLHSVLHIFTFVSQSIAHQIPYRARWIKYYFQNTTYILNYNKKNCDMGIHLQKQIIGPSFTCKLTSVFRKTGPLQKKNKSTIAEPAV